MNRRNFVGGVLLIALILTVLSTSAQAAHPFYRGYGGGYGGGGYGSGGYGYGGYGGYGYGNWGGYLSDQVPYFAWYPPVYYGAPVAHGYGFSPFPNPPYGGAGDGSYEYDGPAAMPSTHLPPLRITNPYVTQGDGAKTAVTATPAGLPKVVYGPAPVR